MSSLRIAGLVLTSILLVMVGAVILLGSEGSTYSKAVRAPSPESLRAIAALGARWQEVVGASMVIVLLLTVGLGLLTLALHRAGDRLLALSALLLFVIGAVLVLVWLAFEMSVTVWAAQSAASTPAAIPAVYEPLARWVDLLFVAFMLLSYLAMAGFGGAVLSTRLLPAWVGWASLLFGVLGTLARLSDLTMVGIPSWLPASVPAWALAGVPGWIAVWGFLLGVALLLTGKRDVTTEQRGFS